MFSGMPSAPDFRSMPIALHRGVDAEPGELDPRRPAGALGDVGDLVAAAAEDRRRGERGLGLEEAFALRRR